MIRDAINLQNPHTEVDEKELDNDAHFTRFNVVTTNDPRMDTTTSEAYDVPYDKAEVWLLINWILKYNYHDHAGKIPNINIRGYAETVGRDNNTGNEKTRKDDSCINTKGF